MFRVFLFLLLKRSVHQEVGQTDGQEITGNSGASTRDIRRFWEEAHPRTVGKYRSLLIG